RSSSVQRSRGRVSLSPQSRDRMRHLWVVLVALSLLVGLALSPVSLDPGHASMASVAASAPSDGPCGPGDACCHDHANCCLSTFSAIPGCAGGAFASTPARGVKVVARSDADRTGCDPRSPFHPPKSLAAV